MLSVVNTVLNCSYGTIPYRLNGDKVEFLLVKEARTKSGHWSLPKGHMTPDDKCSRDTALRELEEETGVVPDVVLDHEPIVQEYSYKHNGWDIDRCIEFTIVKIEGNPVIVPQAGEISDCRWMTINEALRVNSFAEFRTTIRDALKIIENQNP